ncbi:MAG: Ig-like domain-containing protein [Thermoanaerobaculia bacterium]|nr:Ig-like domain-containing protein [Thermoanaerobaculia bacterium]
MRFRSVAYPVLPLLLLSAFFGFSCSSADHPTAPAGTTLTITASSTKIGLNGSAQINVTGFRPEGNRLPEGTLIRFSASLGTIEPAVTTIGADGFARAVFRADGRAGTASVTANLSTGSGGGGGGGGDGGDGGDGGSGSGAGTGAESASVSIEVSTEQPTLLISANPSAIDVLETSEVTITARDENSLPLGAGEEILLTANLGTISVNGTQVDSVQTEADGRARVTFTAGNEPGEGGVSAILRNSEEASVTITISDAPNDLFFDASPRSIQVSGGTVELTATVVNRNSDPIGQVVVGFEAGEGSLNPSSALSNAQGIASSTLTVADSEVDDSTGSFTVSASIVVDGREIRKVITIRVE